MVRPERDLEQVARALLGGERGGAQTEGRALDLAHAGEAGGGGIGEHHGDGWTAPGAAADG